MNKNNTRFIHRTISRDYIISLEAQGFKRKDICEAIGVSYSLMSMFVNSHANLNAEKEHMLNKYYFEQISNGKAQPMASITTNKTEIYSHPQLGTLRSVVVNSIRYFVGVDIGKALGYSLLD